MPCPCAGKPQGPSAEAGSEVALGPLKRRYMGLPSAAGRYRKRGPKERLGFRV